MKLVQARRLYLLEEALSQLADLQSRLGLSGAAPAPSGTAPATPPRPADRTGGPPSSGPLRTPPRAVAESVKPAAARGQSPAEANPPPSTSDRDTPPFAAPRPVPATEVAPRAVFKPAPAEEPPAPPEPPDYSYLDEPELPAGNGRGIDGDRAIGQIIAALEAKRKIMLALALEKAAVKIDGDFLIVTLAPENARDKMQLDGKDKRQLIEEISREVTGRRLTLSVSVGGMPEIPAAPARPPAERKKAAAEMDPKIQALAEKFRAEKIDIIKPD
jgi:hypothetical protein